MRAAAALLIAAGIGSASAENLSAKVIRVSDGESLVVAAGARELRVRVVQIDAPERGQPYWLRSRESLQKLCEGKQARVSWKSRDAAGRALGRVQCAGVDAGAEQVRRGMAWVSDKEAGGEARLFRLEQDARTARRGLWADPKPVPPWRWHAKPRYVAKG